MLGHVLFISGEQSKAVGGVQNPAVDRDLSTPHRH